jgi:hypothetical protein
MKLIKDHYKTNHCFTDSGFRELFKQYIGLFYGWFMDIYAKTNVMSFCHFYLTKLE